MILDIPIKPLTIDLIDDEGNVIDTVIFTFQEIKQNQKLRELVERRINFNINKIVFESKDDSFKQLIDFETNLLRSLLDEAKK